VHDAYLLVGHASELLPARAVVAPILGLPMQVRWFSSPVSSASRGDAVDKVTVVGDRLRTASQIAHPLGREVSRQEGVVPTSCSLLTPTSSESAVPLRARCRAGRRSALRSSKGGAGAGRGSSRLRSLSAGLLVALSASRSFPHLARPRGLLEAPGESLRCAARAGGPPWNGSS
jgi:hypothetical protein